MRRGLVFSQIPARKAGTGTPERKCRRRHAANPSAAPMKKECPLPREYRNKGCGGTGAAGVWCPGMRGRRRAEGALTVNACVEIHKPRA